MPTSAPSTDIVALLEAASSPGGTLITDAGGTDVHTPHSVVWARAGAAGADLARRSDTGSVAMMLVPSEPALASLVGAWRWGLSVASLPLAPRSASSELTSKWAARLCVLADADVLVVDDAQAAKLGPVPGVSVITFAECAGAAGPASGPARAVGRFVQFSSGSTGDPKGIVLSLSAIGANALAVYDALGHEDLTLVSSLPISHDLGLMAALSSWVGMTPGLGGPGHQVLLEPARYLMSPARWLDRLDRHRATVTAGPPTAFEFAVRRPPRRPIDLSSLRVALLGAEPIRADVLRSFTEAFAPAGLDPTSLCPAYGLAEATVGVSAVRLGEGWRSVRVEREDLTEGAWTPRDEAALELVSNGRPLTGVEVRVDPLSDLPIGHLQVRSPSLAHGCLGSGALPIADGWLTTSDLGHVDQTGEVFVVGRSDDVIVLGGRNLHPEQLERSIVHAGLTRSSNCAVVSYEQGYAVVAERPRRRLLDDGELCRSIRTTVTRDVGVGPAQVVLVDNGWLPRTVTGKIQRQSVAAAIRSGDAPSAFSMRFDGRD